MSTMTPNEAIANLEEFFTGGASDMLSVECVKEALSVLRSALEWYTEPPEKSGRYYAELTSGKDVWCSLEHYSTETSLHWSTLCTVTRWTHLPIPPEVK